jgi:hypothetical protein
LPYRLVFVFPAPSSALFTTDANNETKAGIDSLNKVGVYTLIDISKLGSGSCFHKAFERSSTFCGSPHWFASAGGRPATSRGMDPRLLVERTDYTAIPPRFNGPWPRLHVTYQAPVLPEERTGVAKYLLETQTAI